MVRAIFLALISVACLACSRSPRDVFARIGKTPEKEFATAVEDYFARYDGVFEEFNFADGARRWDHLSRELYRSTQAWSWLEKYNDFGNVRLKSETRLEDLPQGVQVALQEFLTWDPYLVEEEVEPVPFPDFCESQEYLSILLDLLGGEHPIWGRYVALLSIGNPPSFAWSSLLDLFGENSESFPKELMQQSKEALRDHRWLIAEALSSVLMTDFLRQQSEMNEFIWGNGEEERSLAYYLMTFDPTEPLPLDDPRLAKWGWGALHRKTEEKAAQLPE